MATCKLCGTYRGPGKFEGEPCYVEALWQNADIDFDDGDTPVSSVTIDADDVARFPCSLDAGDIGKVVLLWESDQGFVWTRGPITTEEAARVQSACEADAEYADD